MVEGLEAFEGEEIKTGFFKLIFGKHIVATFVHLGFQRIGKRRVQDFGGFWRKKIINDDMRKGICSIPLFLRHCQCVKASVSDRVCLVMLSLRIMSDTY